jgi:hypothetical protein
MVLGKMTHSVTTQQIIFLIITSSTTTVSVKTLSIMILSKQCSA